MQRLLIANRGEIAIRVARSAADMQIGSVAVFAEDDAASLHVKRADEAVALKGRGVKAYLDIEQLLAIAKAHDCDAIHPGYGFLSENAEFSRRCSEEGICFIGASAELLDQLGNKATARQLALDAGTPLIRGLNQACSMEEVQVFHHSLGEGAAIMIKALAGGGGRGMRAVTDAGEIADAYQACKDEATIAFGSGDVYVEQLVQNARHIEVQVLGDGSGQVAHAWKRECTLQRRNQKLLEIAPSPSLDEDTRRPIINAALHLASTVRYRGLGTFEFLLDAEDSSKFYFMEINPRVQVETCMGLLTTTTDYNRLGDVDLVIEAVFESMDVKKKVFASLDQVCKPGAILATNTSTLDINEIAASISRPQDVIGLHFFSPAHIMRLLEIVRADATAPDVIATCLGMAKKIRKQAVVVGVCLGFVGNRMFEPYIREAHRLVLEGASPAQIGRVFFDFGMAMGPLAVIDLAGNDVGYLIRESRRDEIAHDPGYNIMGDRLVALGRNGQKTGRGFSIYEGRDRQEDPEVVELATQVAAELGIERREISDQEILERCLYPLINEGADVLHEGIATRSSDIDIVYTNGYGFPVWRGGPMQYADEIGPDKVLARLNHYRESLGAYGETWFQPSELLEQLVAEGRRFRQYQIQ